ncbi:phage tail assembly chaperone [Burkholderia ambifaria]|uniref:XkdW family protein n=1 Tax=Burkholderia ambifaria TaxID=152480 RepID=UPI001593642D|nr:phage tail assembly chaperone [Burkholderia ambifaria]
MIDFSGFTHDHMVIALQMMFPDLVSGRDYRCFHQLDAEGNQVGLPMIGIWRSNELRCPSDEEVHAFFEANEEAIRAKHIRMFRDMELLATDGKANAPVDAPPQVRELSAQWQNFRQSLRDVPEQEGFPFNVEWPDSPHVAQMTGGMSAVEGAAQ